MTANVDRLEQEFIDFWQQCSPMTMTSIERMYALYKAVHYVLDAGIPGHFVECGVWKGGSVMLIASILRARGITDRQIILFDTFEGMTAPTDTDIDLGGVPAAVLLEREDPGNSLVWAISPLDEVKANLARTGFPMERFVFVKGDVAETIPAAAPDAIALLRLDTDWYESTRHELHHLFPRLAARGVLIIDDYGHYLGARKAVDEYLAGLSVRYLLNRIDYTGRILVKA